MTEGDSEFVRHVPCDACGSSDANAEYSDGHTHCFACGVTKKGDGQSASPRPPTKRDRMDLLSGEIEAIPQRGLTRETCEKYGYRIGTYQGRKCHIAPYHDESGSVVAQKIRYKRDGEKAFTFAGEPKEAGLFGARMARTGGKMIVITEGEIDALSAAQALGLRWPVVSLPNGASAARRDLAKHTGFLETFDKIVLCFDMDKPGREAVADVVGLFAPGKVYVASLPLKDANEMVVANRSAELVDALFGAKVFRPDGIRTVADLIEKALAPQQWGLPWPWKTFTKRTYGIQRRYIYAWGAGVGSGKTTTQKQLMLTAMRPDLLEDHGDLGIPIPPPRSVGTILFEENPAKTLRSLAGMALGKRLNKPDVEVTDDEIRREIKTFDNLFFPLDCFGAKDWDTVKANIKFLVLSEGVKDIFIDPLTALVAGEEDERRALDAIMADMSGLVEAYDFTIHLVSHLTTPQGTAHEEGGRVLEKHFTGSRAIARWSHAMLGLERNKQEPDSPTTLRGLKDREHGEAVGPLLGLTFDRDTGRMVECALDGDSDCPFSTTDGNDDL